MGAIGRVVEEMERSLVGCGGGYERLVQKLQVTHGKQLPVALSAATLCRIGVRLCHHCAMQLRAQFLKALFTFRVTGESNNHPTFAFAIIPSPDSRVAFSN